MPHGGHIPFIILTWYKQKILDAQRSITFNTSLHFTFMYGICASCSNLKNRNLMSLTENEVEYYRFLI